MYLYFYLIHLIERQELRGNIEDGGKKENKIDPMKIQPQWRDHHPKFGLDGKYIGDEYIICSDIPSHAFLKKGAKFRLLGKDSVSKLQHPHRDDEGNTITHILDSTSDLLTLLCQESVDGKCRYPSSVEIENTINCVGIECAADNLQIIQVAQNIYYEYLKPPCINFPFFNNGKYSLMQLEDGNKEESGCIDERYRFNAPYFRSHFIFTARECEVIAVVNEDGRVAVERENTVAYDSLTYFRVHWRNDKFPHASNNKCGNSLCETIQNHCRCMIVTEDLVKFTSAPSRNDVLTQLSIGAIPLNVVDYDSMITTYDGVRVHFKSQMDRYDMDTAFEVTDDFGRILLLKNMVSLVSFRQTTGVLSTDYQFRNPPSFHNAIPETR
jgi:hypothetical protein